MKIWISKNSEVPVSEQLATQITLGIAAGDLRIGEKLPSTREIARRCCVHPNTVGSVYRKLVDQDLLQFRAGSGFYVAESAGRRIEGARRLDELVERLLEEAKSLGFNEQDVLKRLKPPRRSSTSGRVTLIESDSGLRDILVHELSGEDLPVNVLTFEEFAAGALKIPSLLVAMFDEKPKLDAILKDSQKCIYLKGRSVAAAMSGEVRPGDNDMIAVVSGWDGFLTFARVMLLAARIDPGNLIVRSTADDDWRSAIGNASVIICDTLTAGLLDGNGVVRSFRVIADESIREVQRMLDPDRSS